MTILENMDDFKVHVIAVTAKELERKRIRELRAELKAAKMAAGSNADKAKALSALLWEDSEPFGCRTPIVANFLSVLIDSPVKKIGTERVKTPNIPPLGAAVTYSDRQAIVTEIWDKESDMAHAHEVPHLRADGIVFTADVPHDAGWAFAAPEQIEALFKNEDYRKLLTVCVTFPLVV